MMQLRRDRTHNCGLTNVDFRSQKDQEKVASFHEQYRSTNFGTMGRSQLFNIKKPEDKKEKLAITSGFQSFKKPNPKVDISQEFYKNLNKEALSQVQMSRTRQKLLEPEVFNDQVFNGEPFKEKTWYESKAKRIASSTEPKKLEDDIKHTRRKNDKLEKHQKASAETQLVKVISKETLEGKINLPYLKEIRRTIRRRYANRSNFRSIFNSWDPNQKERIESIDIYEMVNKLGIKINLNEARVLLASADADNKGFLNLEDFIQLIFSTNENMDVNLNNIPTISGEYHEMIEPTKEMFQKISEAAQKGKHVREINSMKSMIQRNIREIGPLFVSSDINKSGLIDYKNFENAIIKRAKLPESLKVRNDMILEIFNEFDEKQTGKINYKSFADHILSFNYNEDYENLDLGPSDVKPEEYNIEKDKNIKRKLNIIDYTKQPPNRLETILSNTLKLNRLIQKKFKTKVDLENDIKQYLSTQDPTSISKESLTNYIVGICKAELVDRKLGRRDIEGFLSSFFYNKHNFTNLNYIIESVYADDKDLSYKLHTIERPIPPEFPNIEKEYEKKEPYDTKKLRQLISTIQDKTFTGNYRIYGIYQDYDIDGDGYVSKEDLKNRIKQLKISFNEAELNEFMKMVDKNKKGYLDFNSFSQKFGPKMTNDLVPDPINQSLFPKDRLNLIPNEHKVKENLNYFKDFSTLKKNLVDKLQPESNRQMTIKSNTRFSGNPPHHNSFKNFQLEFNTGMHLIESDRLLKGDLNLKVDFLKTDKCFKQEVMEAKIKRIRDHQDQLVERKKNDDILRNNTKERRLNNRIASMKEYESRCHIITSANNKYF